MTQTQIPTEYLCPITQKLMKDPMMSKYGHHFERSAIIQHLANGNNHCPVTGKPLRPSNLVSNKTLQWKIKYWADKNGLTEYVEETTDMTQVESVGFIAVYPGRFICPLTKKVMRDPVMTKEGVNYERRAILQWLDSSAKETCPVTSIPLTRRGLVSNSKLQWEIEQWEKKNGKTESSVCSDTLSSLKKLPGSEMVSRDMSIVSSLVRSLPLSLNEGQGDPSSSNDTNMVKPKNLLEVLDAALNCSLRV
jgi:hypothetical protein